MAGKALKWRINDAVLASSLPPFARLLMLVFSDLAEGDGRIPDDRTPSLKELERMTGMGKASVVRHKAELVRLGWLDYAEPTVQQMSAHETGTYRIMLGRNPEPESESQSETPKTARKKDRKASSRSHRETPAPSHGETPKAGPENTTGVSQRDGAGSHSETASSYRPQSSSLSTAAGAAAHVPVDALFAEPRASPTAETDNQRAQRLAKTYTDRVKLSNFMGVRAVVVKAMADEYTDQQITDGLNRLRAENRVVSANTLKIAMDGQPRNTNGHQTWQGPGTDDPNAYSGKLL